MKRRFFLAFVLTVLLSLLPMSAQAGYSYYLEVGDTETLKANMGNYVIHSAVWTSSDPNSVQIVSPGIKSCYIKVIGPSTFSTVTVQCTYQYYITMGSYSYLAQGYDSFTIHVLDLSTPTPKPTATPTPRPTTKPTVTPKPTARPTPTPSPTPRPADHCGDNCTWSISGETLTITGSGAMYDYSSASQQPWYGRKITSVQVGSGVTAIGSHAFEKMTSLARVALPQTLSTLNSYAFSGCTSLRYIDVPDWVSAFGKYCFAGSGLRYIDMPSNLYTLGDYSFADCTKLRSIVVPDVYQILSNTFQNCTSLETVALCGTDRINTCLRGNSSIKNLYISWQYIYSPYALEGTNLEHIYYTGSRSSWDSNMGKEWNRYIKNATFHPNYTYGDGGETEDYNFLELPARLRSVQKEAFMGTDVNYVILHDRVTGIGVRAFADCKNLRVIEIPASVTAINGSAFNGCTDFEIITSAGSYAESYAQKYNFDYTIE